MTDYDVLVVGGGVVGLATARAVAMAGLSVVLVESNDAFGMETSSRNSEVIHAGIYYPPGSLKARLCVEGRSRLYDFAERRGVAFRRCGKLIVATDPEQVADLERIQGGAMASGVESLRFLSKREIQDREPALRCADALFSPDTGIVDSHGFMMALAGEAEANGATLVLRCEITRLARAPGGGLSVWVAGEDHPILSAGIVVNAAGLGADGLLSNVDGYRGARPPVREWAKGNYFAYTKAVPFSSLIYPVPVPGGLGIHLTLDLAGCGRFGPDVEWTNRLEYDVDNTRRDDFARSIERFWPAIEPQYLEPAYAGIRPKLYGREQPNEDFLIETSAEHGIDGLINLLGIESPGLTASLALADAVRDVIRQS